MCDKAKKIQKLWNHERGDFFVREKEYYRDTPFVIDFYKKIFNECFEKDEKFIWLPRQDQLQEMVTLLFCSVGGECFLLDYFYTFYKSLKEKIKGMSMEQLWLAFVMKEKYQKTWNGKDWEKNV